MEKKENKIVFIKNDIFSLIELAKEQKKKEEEVLKFFKCYRSDVSCIDCEFKEPCNVFVYVKQQMELEEENKKIAEAIHYPECWDTMAYPTLVYALWEMIGIDFTKRFCPTCKKQQGFSTPSSDKKKEEYKCDSSFRGKDGFCNPECQWYNRNCTLKKVNTKNSKEVKK